MQVCKQFQSIMFDVEHCHWDLLCRLEAIRRYTKACVEQPSTNKYPRKRLMRGILLAASWIYLPPLSFNG
ncbi:hypothetical protein V8B97DRAFT_1055460 [Scleroderma yunnanense]